MNRQPKIYTLPLSRLGTHETLVIVLDGVPHSLDTWNYVENEKGDKTFFIEARTDMQLTFPAGSFVSVIR